ncbi:hypothetical protein [Collimonas fungivorans]|uniref:hypothetical protein n=1 Tax=Collimonas fungivorans TaxID=158899 RepID=UPI003FA3C2DD
MLNLFKKAVAPLAAVVTGLFAVTSANAAGTGTDFSSIASGIDASTIVTAIVAMGAIMILPGVAKWGAKKLATFFG